MDRRTRAESAVSAQATGATNGSAAAEPFDKSRVVGRMVRSLEQSFRVVVFQAASKSTNSCDTTPSGFPAWDASVFRDAGITTQGGENVCGVAFEKKL